jgi:predicted metal-dependent hydrolase
VSGECLFYLGRRYQLKVRKTEADDPGVKLLRGRICVSAPSGAAVVRTRLAEWYRRRAMEVFRQRLLDITERVGWRGEIPRWRLVSMRKQWGSCSPSGVILLNPHLVKAPRECVDYVICHELCHLKEHNHSPRYYRILRKVMPDWERVKARLDGMAEMLLNE